MTHLTALDLECFSTQELKALYTEILNAISRSGKTIDECPELARTLANIRSALQRRQPKGPGLR